MSAPANTVPTCCGLRSFCSSAMAMPGRALPAAQPHTELTTIIVVPSWATAWSTVAGGAQLLDAKAGQLLAHRGHELFWIRHGAIVR